MSTGLDLSRTTTLNETGEICVERHPGWGSDGKASGWIARLSVINAGRTLERTFPDATRSDLSRAGNGCKYYRTADLPSGVYEADSIYRSYQTHTVYFQITDGQIALLANQREAELAVGYDREVIDAARKAEQEQAAQTLALPAIEGSERQVKWALDLRGRLVRLLETDNGGPLTAEQAERLRHIKQARWFIDNRDALRRAFAALPPRQPARDLIDPRVR